MKTLSFRPRTVDDDPKILEIYLQHENVFRFSLDEWRFHLDGRAREAGKEPVLRVGEIEGRIVGSWYIEPHYSGGDGVFFAEVEVDEREQRKGYGLALWEDLERYLEKRGVTKLYDSLREDLEPGKRFAEARGFRKTGRAERISRLELASANLDGYEDIDERMTKQGITITTAADIDQDDESFMRELHAAVSAMLEDIPRTEATFEPTPYEFWRQNFLKSPGTKPEAYWLALEEGHPVGMANLQIMGSEGVFNGLTGVVPGQRHRGIARALKYRTILWAREQGYKHIDTANDAANAPMLSINVPLGYKAFPAREEWLKEYTR